MTSEGLPKTDLGLRTKVQNVTPDTKGRQLTVT